MGIQAITGYGSILAAVINQPASEQDHEDFDSLFNEENTAQGIRNIQGEIGSRFHIKLYVTGYACGTTDDAAKSYDLAMVDSGQFRGDGNIVISKKTLLKMEKDVRFRNKVYASIKGLEQTGVSSGGAIKSTGAVIHEDGTAGYWAKPDWGEEEGNGKKTVSDRSLINEPNQKHSEENILLSEYDFELQSILMGKIAGTPISGESKQGSGWKRRS